MQKTSKNLLDTNPKELQMKFVAGELAGLRKVISYLWDQNNEAFAALLFVKSNYVEWPAMITWMKNNGLRGQALVDFFKNESPDGGGYHMGATFILSRLKGHKTGTVGIKADELLS
jgi:hypothetical protein